MALKVPWKALSKRDTFSSLRDTFSSKRGVFYVAVGLFLVVGLVLRSGDYFGQPEVEQKAPLTTAVPTTPSAPATPAVEPAESVAKPQPPAQETVPAQETATTPGQQTEQTGETAEQPEQTGEAVEEQAGQPELPDAGTILVSRRSVEVLSGPSASSSSMYGFPAGRQFRVIGREGGFIQIKDVVSGASGWIDEAGLAPPPRMPDVSAPSQSRPTAVGRTRATGAADPKPKTTKDSQVTADAPEPVQTRKRPGLFGGDGPFRGIFGGGN